MLYGLVQLHLKLNPELYSEHAPMEKKVIYLADLHAAGGARLDAGKQAATLAVLQGRKAQLGASKQKLEAIVPKQPRTGRGHAVCSGL